MPKFCKFVAALAFMALACFVGLPIMAAAPVPPGNTGSATSDSFQHASPYGYSYVCHQPVIWIPLFHNFVVASTTTNDGGITTTTTSTVTSMGAGTISSTEIATSELGGFLLDSDNDSVSFMIPFPADLDKAKPIYIRELWSNSTGAVTGTMAWVHSYTVETVGTSAIAVGGTTTGITEAAAVADSGTANVLQWSGWATIAASTFTATAADDVLVIKVAGDLTTITDATLYGVQVKYSRKYLGCDNQ